MLCTHCHGKTIMHPKFAWRLRIWDNRRLICIQIYDEHDMVCITSDRMMFRFNWNEPKIVFDLMGKWYLVNPTILIKFWDSHSRKGSKVSGICTNHIKQNSNNSLLNCLPFAGRWTEYASIYRDSKYFNKFNNEIHNHWLNDCDCVFFFAGIFPRNLMLKNAMESNILILFLSFRVRSKFSCLFACVW